MFYKALVSSCLFELTIHFFSERTHTHTHTPAQHSCKCVCFLYRVVHRNYYWQQKDL